MRIQSDLCLALALCPSGPLQENSVQLVSLPETEEHQQENTINCEFKGILIIGDDMMADIINNLQEHVVK